MWQPCLCADAAAPGADPWGGGNWGDRSLKPKKGNLVTMILYNSENSIRDIRPVVPKLFCPRNTARLF